MAMGSSQGESDARLARTKCGSKLKNGKGTLADIGLNSEIYARFCPIYHEQGKKSRSCRLGPSNTNPMHPCNYGPFREHEVDACKIIATDGNQDDERTGTRLDAAPSDAADPEHI